MIELREEAHGIRLLRMRHGKANAFDLEFSRAFADTVDRLDTADTRAVVVTGTGTIFSAGVDLFRVLEGGADYVDQFVPELSRAFESLFRLERPVVAAINGHAIAGGCVLACAADARVMVESDGARIGVPELLVGVPFPAIALEVVRSCVSPSVVGELVLRGTTLQPTEAAAAGLVDELAGTDQVLSRALARAERLAAIPRDAFALTKRQLRRPALDLAERARSGLDAEVARVWADERTRASIQSYVDRTLGKKS